jgi:hypothetical protein
LFYYRRSKWQTAIKATKTKAAATEAVTKEVAIKAEARTTRGPAEGSHPWTVNDSARSLPKVAGPHTHPATRTSSLHRKLVKRVQRAMEVAATAVRTMVQGTREPPQTRAIPGEEAASNMPAQAARATKMTVERSAEEEAPRGLFLNFLES